MKIKRVGVFTSGGDCAGLNFAIGAVVKRCAQLGAEVIGFENGPVGMMGKSPFRPLPITMPWGEIMRQGSTFLGAFSNGDWAKPLKPGETEKDKRESEIPAWGKTIKKHKLDVIIGTNGNGSTFYSAGICKKLDVPFVGIPKTLDNDVLGTDFSVGFESTVQFCSEMIDNLFWTGKGHGRIMIAEVMGRDVGHLALHAGLASGADIILIPEIKYSMTSVIDKIKAIQKSEGRRHGLIVVAEGAGGGIGDEDMVSPPNTKFQAGCEKFPGVGEYLEAKLKENGINARSCRLGHTQRGASTGSFDRKLAHMMGALAVDSVLAMKKPEQKLISFSNGRIIVQDIDCLREIHEKYVDLDSDEVRAAKALGIYLGENKQ